MLALLLPFALKSLLVAGAALLLLHLLRDRSAAERGMVAHSGLLALLIIPLGAMMLPQLPVAVPLLTSPAPDSISRPPSAARDAVLETTSGTTAIAGDQSQIAIDLWPLLYAVPVVALLALTIVAVLRLLALRARASVLVEPRWLTALAHAQRRMNFKHGTALLVSSDLKSPISWGIFRPVILINDQAIGAHGEAEAIIAHELAHVRGFDWAKLLLARIVTAIFWFNPLVWLLAREAHQLREESADDAVLGANVTSTDYAQLLIGVARHDGNGLLLGAHGVAPGRYSLSRRVRRVLDGSLPRAPVARGFALGMILGVIGTAAPLAALTMTAAPADQAKAAYQVSAQPASTLPGIVARSVVDATAITGDTVGTTLSALAGEEVDVDQTDGEIDRSVEAELSQAERQMGRVHPHPRPAPDPRPLPRPEHGSDRHDDRIAAAALGITPQYEARIRAAAPHLRFVESDFVALRALGVEADWLREIIRAGFRPRDVDDVNGARAVGLKSAYVAELAAEGYRGLTADSLTSMRALGVSGDYIRRLRAAGHSRLSPDRLVELRALGVGLVPQPGRPAAPGWIRDNRRISDAPPPVASPPALPETRD